jgi:hypothetical protein
MDLSKDTILARSRTLLAKAQTAVARSRHTRNKAAAVRRRAQAVLGRLSRNAKAASPERIDRAFTRIWLLIHAGQENPAQAPRLIPRILKLLEFTERLTVEQRPARMTAARLTGDIRLIS